MVISALLEFISPLVELLFKYGPSIASNVTGSKDQRKDRIEILKNPKNDINYHYNETLVKNFVLRRFAIYAEKIKSEKLNRILSKIAYKHQKGSRQNVIITGQAGIGKTTVLKWLFLNLKQNKFYNHVTYISSKMVRECKSLNDLKQNIKKKLDGKGCSIIFFDGLDELPFLSGKKGELEEFLDMFEKEISSIEHKFVITSRPEHFGLHDIIFNQNFRGAENYIIYEVLPLNQKEVLKVCKTIKKLQKYENEEDLIYSHFKNKWPLRVVKDGSLNEKQYLRKLKKFIKENKENESLLASPLLCRYAYQVVSDWRSTDDNDNSRYTTLTERINRVINSYIKWEFHDEYEENTSSEKGRNDFKKYKDKVIFFLSNIAHSTGTDDLIDKSVWEKFRNQNKISINAAYCVLLENDGKLTFIHRSFKEYFLAFYYIILMYNNKINITNNIEMISVLETNLSFLQMFTEFLLSVKIGLIKDICSYLLEGKNNQIERVEHLSKYVNGSYCLIFQPSFKFTIEQYLTIFPLGIVEYAGYTFDRERLKQLLYNGVLEIDNIGFLPDCTIRAISDKLKLDTIRFKPKYTDEIKLLTISFNCVYNNTTVNIGGYLQEQLLTIEEIYKIINSSDYFSRLGKSNITINDILSNDEYMDQLLEGKKQRDEKKRADDNNKLYKWGEYIINFLGSDGNYWLFYNETTLIVHRMTPENAKRISNDFNRGLSRNVYDYLSLMGGYMSLVKEESQHLSSLVFKKNTDISFVFDANDRIINSGKNYIANYYIAHWENRQLFKINEYFDDIYSKEKKIYKAIKINEILDLYEEVEDILKNQAYQKFHLIISDEKLITYYFLKENEKMTAEAKDTLELCDKFGHILGKELRLFLLKDDTSFTGEDKNIVYKYLEDYIWF